MVEGNKTGFRTRRAAERLSVGPALGMSLMDSFGITEIIDRTCGHHGESALSPGNAVKAICGTMFTDNKRKALYNVEDSTPVHPYPGSSDPRWSIRHSTIRHWGDVWTRCSNRAPRRCSTTSPTTSIQHCNSTAGTCIGLEQHHRVQEPGHGTGRMRPEGRIRSCKGRP